MSQKPTRHFRGRFENKLDAKGRLSLPAHYSQALAKDGTLVITNSRFHQSQCLHAYRMSEWMDLEKKVDALSPLEPAVQAFNRFYLAAAQELELDAQNRIVIPQSLRKFASLEFDVVLVGLGDKFEIWSQSVWEKVFGGLTESFEDIQQQLSDLMKGANR